MIIECLQCWSKHETEKPNAGTYRVTCPACNMSAVVVTISLMEGIRIIQPTETPPTIKVWWGADRKLAPSTYDRRMGESPGLRRSGFDAIGELEAPLLVRVATLCPCPVIGCSLCCCGHLNCANRLGGRPRCRCEWVDIGTLNAGQCFQDSDEGHIGMIWIREGFLSQVRRVYTVDDEDSELGEVRTVFHNDGNLVKVLPTAFIPAPGAGDAIKLIRNHKAGDRITIPKSRVGDSLLSIFRILEKHGLDDGVWLKKTTLCIPVKVTVTGEGGKKIVGLKDMKDNS